LDRIKNLHLFYGGEGFLVDEQLKELKAGLLPDGANDINYESIDGRSASPDVIVSSLSSAPMLGGVKLVVISELKALTAGGRARKKASPRDEGSGEGEEEKEDSSQLFASLKNLPDNVHVAFIVHGEVDKRRKLYKFIEDNGRVLQFKPFAEWEQEKLLAWIVAWAKTCGKTIKSQAARRLAEISDNDLRSLSQEIDKIAAYVGDGDSIEEKDVEAVASRGSIGVFSLVDSLRARDIKASLSALVRLIRDKQDPVPLLGLIAKQFRMILQIRSLMDSGLTFNDIASKLRANSYFLKKTAEGADRFSAAELRRNIEILHKADLQLKTTSLVPQSVLELAVVDLCS
jgi:DNA polymerase-3 subunit delta